MKPKTVFDELLSYKIPQDELKLVADAFISLQEAGVPVPLEDLIQMYRKRANIKEFAELSALAAKENLILPVSDFREAKLSRDEYTNLLRGWIHAQKIKIETSFDDLAKLAKTKLDLVLIINSLAELKELEPSISFAEFTACKYCLFKTEKLIKAYQKLKKTDKGIDLRYIFNANLDPSVITGIIDIHEKLKSYNSKIELKSLFTLKLSGVDVDKLSSAVLKAKEYGLEVNWDTALRIEKKTKNIAHVIDAALSPETLTYKPVYTVLKNGTELILKIKIRREPCIEDYLNGIYGNLLVSKLKDVVKEVIAEYDSVQEIFLNSSNITEHILKNMEKVTTSYKITDFVIDDIEVGHNLKNEEILRELRDKRLFIEEQAKLLEAELRLIHAKEALALKTQHSENKDIEH